MMRKLTRTERSKIMMAYDVYLPYDTQINRDDFTLWKICKTGGMDRVNVDRKIVSMVIS